MWEHGQHKRKKSCNLFPQIGTKKALNVPEGALPFWNTRRFVRCFAAPFDTEREIDQRCA